MKTSKEFIDELHEYEKGISTSSVTHAAQRRKTLAQLQRGTRYLWNAWGWAFKRASEDVTITNGVGNLPTNFSTFGPEGGVTYGVGYSPLRWIPFSRWKEEKEFIGTPGTPQFYTEGWMGQLGASDEGRRQLCVYPLLASGTVTVSYDRTCPVLVDETSQVDDEMLEWPPAFETVIFEIALWYHMKDVGNVQASTEQGPYVNTLLRELKRSERAGQAAPHIVTPYRGWRRR